MALFTFTSGPTSDVIFDFAANFQFPVVSASPAVDESLRRSLRLRQLGERDDSEMVRDETAFAFHVRPLYTGAVIDVVHHYNWQHVFYVFDDADGMTKTCFMYLTQNGFTARQYSLLCRALY